MKEKFKSYTFWISIASAIVLIVQNVGKAVGFVVNDEVVMNIVNSICGFLVVMGIINKPNKTEKNLLNNANGLTVIDEVSDEEKEDEFQSNNSSTKD